MALVLSTRSLDSAAVCAQCGEELIAPAWCGHVSAAEIHNFWCCSKCGYMFETPDILDAKAALTNELVEEFLPSLLVA